MGQRDCYGTVTSLKGYFYVSLPKSAAYNQKSILFLFVETLFHQVLQACVLLECCKSPQETVLSLLKEM